jgi:hypothetical protein
MRNLLLNSPLRKLTNYRYRQPITAQTSTTMAPKDTAPILNALRKLMKDRRYVQEPLAAYIVPSCDAHNSEYLADIDQRREAVSGFTGSAGTGIVTAGQVRG